MTTANRKALATLRPRKPYVTRAPATIHAWPSLPGSGDHRASASCPCRPLPMVDLLEPSRVVYIHQVPAPRQLAEPPR